MGFAYEKCAHSDPCSFGPGLMLRDNCQAAGMLRVLQAVTQQNIVSSGKMKSIFIPTGGSLGRASIY